MSFEETLKVLNALSAVFGPYLATLIFITLLIVVLILLFLKKRIENIADEISKKAIKKIESKLELSLRNEAIRKELVLYQGKKSIDKQVEIYFLVLNLYFHYQKSWEWIKETKKYETEINELLTSIFETRKKIFINSVYLSETLLYNLISAVITMWNLLEKNCAENDYYNIYKKYNNKSMNSFIKEAELCKFLDNAEKYIKENFYTSQSTKQYDFTDEQKKILESERNALFNL